METGLFEIQADYLRDFTQSRQTQTKLQEIIYARFERADSVDADPDRATRGSPHEREIRPSSGPGSIDPATELARCFLRLANLSSCPLDRLILAGMKQFFGARLARPCLLWMRWIVANHEREGAVFRISSRQTCRPTETPTVELPDVSI